MTRPMPSPRPPASLAHSARCELSLATSYATALHLAPTNRMSRARLTMALDCAFTAHHYAAMTGVDAVQIAAQRLVDAIFDAMEPPTSPHELSPHELAWFRGPHAEVG